MRIYGLIPAAGKSVRMGRPKLSLPLGESTVLERVLAALKPLPLAEILLVLGPSGADLVAVAESGRTSVLLLAEETPDMRTTSEHGLSWLEDRHHPAADDCILLCPADHAALDSAVAARLISEASAKPKAGGIWVPTFDRRRGHPLLLAWEHVEGIRRLPRDHGINAYLRDHAPETTEIAWHSPDILLDLDTPADYEKLRARFE